MCVVSFITDIESVSWPKVYENRIKDYITTTPFSNWTFAACEAYVELLEKARKFDEINNERHCDDPNKTATLRQLKDRIEELGLNGSVSKKKALALSVRLEEFMKGLNK